MPTLSRDDLMRWVESYERAWRSPGVEALRDLFAQDATYSPGPYDRTVVGLEAISTFWEEERDGPDEEFTMTAAPVAVEGDTGVVRVHVRYGAPRSEYADLWVVTLDADGRCTAFEEWPFAPND